MPASTLTEPLERGAGGNGGAGRHFGSGGPAGPDFRAPERVYVTGMLMALGGILMFFSAFVSAWVVRRGWPNTDWQPITMPHILWLNTLVLCASGVTVAYSRRCLCRGCEANHRYWWAITTILGVVFVLGQLLVWRQMFTAGLLLTTSPSSSFFYVFTAAHGLHVLGGIAALVAVALRPPRRLTQDAATRVIALYWHFLGALWLLILAVLWLGE
jgi:cytochrome c oxidase subunit III